MADSAPPVTTRSQSPHWIARQAIPIACPAEAQALDVVKAVPIRPYLMATCPLTALAMMRGMKCGLTRRGPRSFSTTCCSRIPVIPPMPVAMIDP